MRIRRWTTAGLAALVAVPALFVANAAPAKAAVGPYGGSASADLVHVLAVGIPEALDPGLADAHVAPSKAQVNSQGLGAPYAGKRSAARATQVDASLLGNAIPLNLLTTAEQTAPPNNATPDVQSLTGPVDLSPLATLEAATATAQARWGSSDSTCVAPGTPISFAKSAVADASVLTGVGDPVGDALVSVVNGNGGVAHTQSTVGLVDVAGQTNKGLRSDSLDQLTGVVLFKGTANEVTLNVVAPPQLTATATGSASTSTVNYTAPVVQIIQGGVETDVLNAADLNTEIELPGVLLRLKLGVLEDVVKTDVRAAGKATLLEIAVLDLTGILTLAQVEIAPMTVDARVPVGGVTCGNSNNPLSNLQVDASTPIVLPGGSFEYAVTVPNIGDCTVNNVKVVLNVTGPQGTTISSITQPPPGSISGLTATWPDIGNIAPGELKVVKAVIKVPAGAASGATFKGTATASGTCAGSPVQHTADSGNVPTVGASSAGCDLSTSGISSSHKEVRIGDFFNTYVRLTNLGRSTCSGVKVTVPYPPNTSFVTCTDSCAHDDAKRVVTWTIPSLASGTSKDLVATFKVTGGKAGDNLGTTVTITSGRQVVTDRTVLPVISAANVLNNGAQRSRGLLARTGADLPLGLGLALTGAFLALRGLRRRLS